MMERGWCPGVCIPAQGQSSGNQEGRRRVQTSQKERLKTGVMEGSVFAPQLACNGCRPWQSLGRVHQPYDRGRWFLLGFTGLTVVSSTAGTGDWGELVSLWYQLPNFQPSQVDAAGTDWSGSVLATQTWWGFTRCRCFHELGWFSVCFPTWSFNSSEL